MLLYLSSNQNIDLVDFLTKEHGVIIKKLSGNFNLKQFVINDMRNISHYSYVLIDLVALNDTQDEIIEAIIAFKSMYYSRLIIFAEGMSCESSLIAPLIEEGIFNIIIATDIEDIQSEILICINEEGKSYHDIVKNTENDVLNSKYTFSDENIKIGVVGTIRRVGTTTTAMNLLNYLSGIGAKVCYTEANNNNHLKTLPDTYSGMKPIEGGFKYKGVDYYNINTDIKHSYNFTVFDFGVLSEKNIKVLKYSDSVILCSGSKPYELEALYNAYEKIKGLLLNTILSSTPEYIRTSLKSKLENENNQVYFADYAPDLFNGNTNKLIWEHILEKYIKQENINTS